MLIETRSAMVELSMLCSTDIRTQFWRRALQRGTVMSECVRERERETKTA